jgi:large subunit ribosomal protein L9e
MVKTIQGQFDVDLSKNPKFENVKLVVKGQKISVTGPRGVETRDFSHLKVELKKTGPQSVRIFKWWGTKRELAAMRTCSSHINNMATGVTSGFRYKMRTVYAHFPINCNVLNDNKTLDIRNFLGEKVLRTVNMLPGVTVRASPKQKDELWFEGNGIENVSRSCALVHQKAMVRNKDIRKFLDGIYVNQKTNIVEDNELLGIEDE